MSRRSRSFNALWPVNPFSMWTRLATQSTEMLLASGEVIAQRSQRMAAMGPNPDTGDRREMQRMVDEKVSAANESVQAMSSRAAGLYQASMLQWFDLMGRQTAAMAGIGRAPRLDTSTRVVAAKASQAAVQITTAGLAPFHRRATANAKRLRKRS